MYLAQHHFQAQSRYFEDSLQFVLGSLSYKAYGVAGCELDPEALLNGTVLLGHARGVFPDGLAFHIPTAIRLRLQATSATPFRPLRKATSSSSRFPPTGGGRPTADRRRTARSGTSPRPHRCPTT